VFSGADDNHIFYRSITQNRESNQGALNLDLHFISNYHIRYIISLLKITDK